MKAQIATGETLAVQAMSQMDATDVLNKRPRNSNGAKVSRVSSDLEKASIPVLPGQMIGTSIVFDGAMAMKMTIVEAILARVKIIWTLCKPMSLSARRVVSQTLESKNLRATSAQKTNARNVEFPKTIVPIGQTNLG
jgi:hypothetical protein